MFGVRTVEHALWVAFAVLFAVVALASVLPVRPVVLVFPAWSLLVMAALLGTIVAVVAATRRGWPVAVAP